jgi:small subunit ribosomal protein S20
MNKKQRNRKNVTQNKRNRMINRRYSSTVRSLSKLFIAKVQTANHANAEVKENAELEVKTLMNKLFSIIDKSVKKGVIHKNNAARRKSAISSISNQL